MSGDVALPGERNGRPSPGHEQAANAAFAELGMAAWIREAATPAAGPGLSAREREVLDLLAAGRTNREIAASLVVAEPTVRRHVANIYRKLGTRNRAESTAYALRGAPLPIRSAYTIRTIAPG
jgi:DNA-binding NarL/FixJ family response regulator